MRRYGWYLADCAECRVWEGPCGDHLPLRTVLWAAIRRACRRSG